MTISLRLNDNDSEIIKAYAKLNNISISELLRESVLERIENEFDIKAYDEAMAEYKADPTTYTLGEVMKELDLD